MLSTWSSLGSQEDDLGMVKWAISIKFIDVGSPILMVGGVIPSAANTELQGESKLITKRCPLLSGFGYKYDLSSCFLRTVYLEPWARINPFSLKLPLLGHFINRKKD